MRDEQLKKFEKSSNEEKISKDKDLSDLIEITKKELKKFNIKPNFNENLLLGENLKNLNKQLDQAKVKNIIQNKNKNKIIDSKFNNLNSTKFNIPKIEQN